MSGIGKHVKAMCRDIELPSVKVTYKWEMVDGFKERLLTSLKSVLNTELELFEQDSEQIEMKEAMAKAEELVQFNLYIMRINNIDL